MQIQILLPDGSRHNSLKDAQTHLSEKIVNTIGQTIVDPLINLYGGVDRRSNAIHIAEIIAQKIPSLIPLYQEQNAFDQEFAKELEKLTDEAVELNIPLRS